MSVEVFEYRLIVERPIPGDSRMLMDEIELVDEADAKRLGRYFRENPLGVVTIRVEQRMRTLWEEV